MCGGKYQACDCMKKSAHIALGGIRPAHMHPGRPERLHVPFRLPQQRNSRPIYKDWSKLNSVLFSIKYTYKNFRNTFY